MGEIILFPFVKRHQPWSRTLQPFTWRDRVSNFLWIVLGIPISLGVFAFQLFGVLGWWPF
jgi:hypothetical protein